MTQSAVTQNLQKMEDELGIQLFERGKKQFVPSEAGESLYLHGKRILEEYDHALKDLYGLGEHLSVCYFAMPSSALKDKVIGTFWKIDPSLIIDQIDCKLADLWDNSKWIPGFVYLVSEEFIRNPDIQSYDIGTVQHYLIMREDHRLREKSRVKPEDLEGETLIFQPKEMRFSHVNHALDQLTEKRIHFQTTITGEVRELAPRILAFGGVAIVPEYITGNVPGVITKPFDDGIDIHVVLAYRKNVSPRIKKLLISYQKENTYRSAETDRKTYKASAEV